MATLPADYLYREPSGRWRRVRVIEWRRRAAVVEYFDNDRRGERYCAGGRRVSHATRVRLVVYRSELKTPDEGWRS